MTRPKKILPDNVRGVVLSDLKFARLMLQTHRLTFDDLESVVRHLDLARNDLKKIIGDNKKEI